ncbi:MAG: hypothetical protein EOL97_15425 [Spirochaetia bacterium]|nr:hypothetical protein [Spirochaetia bacterium]
MNTIICDAIKNKKIIKFIYNDCPRVVEPYCYGESRTGKLVLRGFQLYGNSESGVETGWKLFSLENINKLELHGNNFVKIRLDYKPEDKGMRKIICHI